MPWVTFSFPTISGSHSDFQFVIRTADFPSAAIDGGGNSFANGGGKFRAYTSSAKTTQLPIDVVTFVTGGTPDIEVWGKAPTAATGNTVYVEDDSVETSQPAVTDTYGRDAVWSNHTARYHCAESSGSLVDSTGNGHSAAPQNSPSYGAAGQIGDAVTVANSSSKYFDVADSTDFDFSLLTSGYSYSLWCDLDSTQADWAGVIMKGTSGNDWGMQRNSSTGDMRIYHGASYVTITDGFGDLAGAGKVLVDVTWDKSDVRYYLDGALHSTVAQTTAPAYNNTYTIKLGAERTGGAVNGDLDEIGIAAELVPSADWIATKYANQSTASTWLVVDEWSGSSTQTLTAALFSGTSSFFGAAVGASIALSASLYTDTDNFNAATLSPSIALSASLYSDGDTFNSHALSQSGPQQTLTASLFNDGDTFYSHSVSPGAVTLSPPLHVDLPFFYTCTLSATYQAAPSLFDDADAFYSASITPGSVTLTSSLFENGNSFYSHSVTQGFAPQTLTASLYDDGDTFYASTLSSGAVGLTASLYSSSNTFYSHSLSQSGALQTLNAQLFSDGDTFHVATVAPGSVGLTVALFDDSDTFYSHSLSQVGGPQTLIQALFSDDDTFYASALAPGPVSVTPSLFSSTPAFYVHSLSDSYPLTVSLFSDGDSFYAHSIVIGGAALTAALSENSAGFYTHTLTQEGEKETPLSRTLIVGARNNVLYVN